MSNRNISAAKCLLECPPLSNVTIKEFARGYCVFRSDRIVAWYGTE